MQHSKISLKKKLTAALAWNFLEELCKHGISSAITIILARFLLPQDYGLIAMTSVFIGLSNSVADSGFRQALIRKKDADQIDFCTVFYTNIFLGVIAYLVLFAFAPLVASFYNEPRLILLLRVIGVVIIINSFQIVQRAGLSRTLDFKTQLKASVPGAFLSGTLAVILAARGAGTWALVAQMLTASLLTTIFLWIYRRWKPTFVYSYKSFKEMFAFGSKLFMAGLLTTLFNNIYVIFIAKLFSATDAGYYAFASKIFEFVISKISRSIQSVTYPALASIQDENVRLKQGYRQSLSGITFFIFPLGLFFAAFAEPIFRLFLSDTWMQAVPYVQLMMLSGIFHPLHSANLNVLKVKGRSDLFLYLEIVKKVIIVAVLVISVPYGIYGILIGKIATTVLAYVINSYFTKKLIGYSVKEQLGDILPNLALSVVISIIMLFIIRHSEYHAIIHILGFGPIAVLVYFFLAHIFKLGSAVLISSMLKLWVKKVYLRMT